MFSMQMIYTLEFGNRQLVGPLSQCHYFNVKVYKASVARLFTRFLRLTGKNIKVPHTGPHKGNSWWSVTTCHRVIQRWTWWRHQMEAFSALLAICAGNSPVPGEFPTQRPVTRSFDVYFDLRLNKRLCKQSWGWWFETLLCPLWRHSNDRLAIGCT